MSENWDLYEPYRPPYWGPVAQLPRAEAQESFNAWVQARAERWEQLRRLLGDGVSLGDGDAEVQSLNDWFRRSVERALMSRGACRIGGMRSLMTWRSS